MSNRIATLSPQEFFQRTPRQKSPSRIDPADCVHPARDVVPARIALAIAADCKDGFPVLSKCVWATVEKDAVSECRPGFVSPVVARLFSEMADQRLWLEGERE